MSWLKAKDWASGMEYSTLFHSGLRAISLRKPRASCTRTSSSGSSSQESGASGKTSRTMPPPPTLFKRDTQVPSPSLSVSTESSSASRPRTPKVMRRHQLRPTKEAHPWSHEESFFDMREYPKFPEEEGYYCVPPIEIDGIRSMTPSQPFFMNLGEMEGVAVTPPTEEPFLLLSSSQDMFLRHPVPWYGYPMSTQVMSLPPRRDRGDGAWMLEESSPEPEVYEFGDEEGRQPDGEPTDWRQFHVDLLATIR